ncbi:hypothetical protein [Pyrococcus abyssi]|uniref:Uncharacterized protein n=1 Tax=Pyrococcus abyssi (strain GE5 / Orsay) TaxID=272844 RepID=G8ZI67_PYRAB|nr:hypothetical protein [Pyrococcus abyssi]CCE70308.1 TPA: hypothetical protein PAB0603.1n [Pyrococcus abyssi GE5]
MGRIIGLFLFLFGLLLILKAVYPGFLGYLAKYSIYIKKPFVGFMLVFIGLFMLSKNKIWRTIVEVAFILYILLYILL